MPVYDIIIVADDKDQFASLVQGLHGAADCLVGWASSLEDAQQHVSAAPPDLMIIDEEVHGITNLQIARQIVQENPIIQLALVSPLSHKDFHEASEGLGVLAQLPPSAGDDDASKLVEALERVSLFKSFS